MHFIGMVAPKKMMRILFKITFSAEFCLTWGQLSHLVQLSLGFGSTYPKVTIFLNMQIVENLGHINGCQ